jgi:hypothetical protein
LSHLPFLWVRGVSRTVYLKVHILVRVPHLLDVLWAGVSSSIHQLYKLYTANIVQILWSIPIQARLYVKHKNPCTTPPPANTKSQCRRNRMQKDIITSNRTGWNDNNTWKMSFVTDMKRRKRKERTRIGPYTRIPLVFFFNVSTS